MKVSELSAQNLQALTDVLNLLKQKTNEHKYLDVIKVLFEMKEEFKDDDEFHPVLVRLIDDTKNKWKKFNETKKQTSSNI